MFTVSARNLTRRAFMIPSSPILVRHVEIDRFDPHPETSHTEHGLAYLTGGRLLLERGGPVEVKPGTVALAPAGVPHRSLGGSDVDLWMVQFCATCLHLDESLPLMSPFRRVRRGALPIVPIAETRRQRVLQLYHELRDESERAVPESLDLMRSLLLLLLGEVQRAMPGIRVATGKGDLVSDALAFIQQRCFDPISLRDVAAAVHRTPAHVAATVKNATGYSVGQWINAGRVAEAAARLAHTDDSIGQIANHIGWQDKTHFIRQFRRAYGMTPAAWRREHRAGHEYRVG